MWKYTLSDVQQKFRDRGFRLLAEEYHHNLEKLPFVCPEGHLGQLSLNKLLLGRGCVECSGRKRKTLEFLRNEFSKQGYQLLSEEYKNDSTPLLFICPEGHHHQICWSNFKQGQRCALCYRDPVTIDVVREECTKRGFELLDEVYVNKVTPLRVRCLNGHVTTKTRGNVLSGNGCLVCSGKQRHTIEFIRGQFAARGLTLVTDFYSGGKQKLEYVCASGHRGLLNWNNFSQGQGCAQCHRAGRSKKAFQWLESLGIDSSLHERVLKVADRVFKVDAFDPQTNTVFEFLGDFWHGNPNRFVSTDVNPVSKKTFGELYGYTVERITHLEQAGFKVVSVWESDYDKACRAQRRKAAILMED